MTRDIYRLIVRMHPPAFRQRFGDEMMSVFDEAARRDSFVLVIDGLMSFARQWLLRTDSWKVFVAVLAALIQLLGFAFVCKDLQRPAETSEVLTATVQQVVFFALVLTCSLFILIMFLIVWNTRFQRRRSTAYKGYPKTVSTVRLLPGRK